MLLGPLGLVCALLVSACGSTSAAPPGSTPAAGSNTSAGTSTAAGTTTSTPSTAAGAGFAAYRSCLQAHGVTFGGFRGGAPGTAATGTRPTLTAAQQKARAACASLRPTGGFGGRPGGGFGGGGFNSTNPAFAKFQTCLKQHGVTTGFAASRGSTTFQTALAACRSLLPSGGFGRGAGPGGGANSATFAKYQACLTAHGVKTGATGQSASKLQAAIAACRTLLPNGGAGTAPTTSTTTATTTG